MPRIWTSSFWNDDRSSRAEQSSLVEMPEKAKGKNTRRTACLPAKSESETSAPSWFLSVKPGACWPTATVMGCVSFAGDRAGRPHPSEPPTSPLLGRDEPGADPAVGDVDVRRL